MRQTARIISTYTADTFGVCSALYELGGMVVMHDPSGCNSTYTTHDEPRWERQPSRIYISGLTEREAILGDDTRLIADVCATARAQRPRFIALIASPVATMIGVDLAAAAKLIARRTGLTAFALPTDGMHYYPRGISLALRWLAAKVPPSPTRRPRAVNVLGVTPLDFPPSTPDSLRDWLAAHGFTAQSIWAMDSAWGELMSAAAAEVNLVLSSGGLAAARTLRQRFGQPFVVGLPVKGAMAALVADDLRSAIADGRSRVAYLSPPTPAPSTLVIGEAVTAQSLAANLGARAVVFRDDCRSPLRADTRVATYESELSPILAELARSSGTLVADPMYRPICPPRVTFVALPHRAFSGRLYEQRLRDLITSDLT